jgi:hypothetical protein
MTTPTEPIAGRDWLLEVEDAASSTWLPIKGIKTITPNPGENREVADATDFDSAGNYEEYTMQTGATLAVECNLEADPATQAQSPGQAYVDSTWGPKTGIDSRNRIRFRHPDFMPTDWAVWTATVAPGEQGGETNGLVGWSATFRRCGAATTMAVTP